MITRSQKPPEILMEDLEIVDDITTTHEGNVLIRKVIWGNTEYVLKSVLRDSIETEDQLTHLFNERQALWTLDHPQINKLVGTSKDQKYLHFVLELVEGITLDKLMQMYHELPSRFIKGVCFQLAQIMKYVHDEGWVYRDLKANNIMIDAKGKVTLIDFGFAKKIEKERTSSFCGTTHSMAPEQFKGDYGMSVDFYAFGILLYELTFKEPPFGYKGADLQQKIEAGITVQHLQKISDPDLRLILQKLLATDEHQRPQTWDEVLAHEYFLSHINDDWDFNDDMAYEIETFGLNRELEKGGQGKTKVKDVFDDLFS